MVEIRYRTIDRQALAERLADAVPNNIDFRIGYALVNVLTPEEFDKKHIPGSINIPVARVQEFARKFDREKNIVIYSASRECPVSADAARKLVMRGFTNVRQYAGGLRDWLGAGESVAGVAAARCNGDTRRDAARATGSGADPAGIR